MFLETNSKVDSKQYSTNHFSDNFYPNLYYISNDGECI